MSSAPFDSRLTGRSLALGVLDGHGRDALPLDGQTMVPMSYRTVRSVQWHRRSWGAVGGASSPHMERGTAPGSPDRKVLAHAVGEDCLDGGLSDHEQGPRHRRPRVQRGRRGEPDALEEDRVGHRAGGRPRPRHPHRAGHPGRGRLRRGSQERRGARGAHRRRDHHRARRPRRGGRRRDGPGRGPAPAGHLRAGADRHRLHAGPGPLERPGCGGIDRSTPYRAVQASTLDRAQGRQVSFLDAFRIRRTRGSRVASMDREATPDDLDALRSFARTHEGVEFFVEPETMVTDTTAVAVASDGEWTRRRVGSPKVIQRVARELGLPVYDVQIVGYPERMRAYNARMKAEGRADRRLQSEGPPPVRTSRPPSRTPRPRPATPPTPPPKESE